MDEVAYRQFRDLEQQHWWFQGRRTIFFSVLDRFLEARADDDCDPPEERPPEERPVILDIGCGMGGMLPQLSRYGTAIGFDMSLESLHHCKERGFHQLAEGDGYHLPFADNSVDLVTLFDCVEHIDDDRTVLRQAARIVKPGGLIMVTVPAYQFLFSDNDVCAHHKRRYTGGELKRKLREAGFTPIKTSYYNVILLPIIVPLVLAKKLKMRLFGVPKTPRSNISYAVNPLLNSILSATFRAERIPMRVLSFPAGHSVLCVARKT